MMIIIIIIIIIIIKQQQQQQHQQQQKAIENAIRQEPIEALVSGDNGGDEFHLNRVSQ